jgi:choline kinase
VDETRRLQALQERGQRAVVEVQGGREVLDRGLAALPEDEEDEVLRVGQLQLLKEGAVRGRQRPLGRVQREAQLLVEEQ